MLAEAVRDLLKSWIHAPKVELQCLKEGITPALNCIQLIVARCLELDPELVTMNCYQEVSRWVPKPLDPRP